MSEVRLVSDIIECASAKIAEKPVFINRDGSQFSYSALALHARFLASELLILGVYGRAIGIMGEVNYSGLAALFGCAFAGVPVVLIDVSLPVQELCSLVDKYDIAGIFHSSKYRQKAEELAGICPSLYTFPELERLFEAVNYNGSVKLPEISPDDPAFLFFTSRDRRAVMLSHKNICENLRSVAEAVDISSYTFLSPSGWGSAYDCTVGLLLPLFAGCTMVKRGEKRGVARAIAESGATALTCTPERLLSLEKSLITRAEKKQGKARVWIANLFGVIFRSMGLGVGKRMYRRLHAMMGDNLKLIICGGAYPDKANICQFSNWGINVYNCYYLTECGAAAISLTPGGKLFPFDGVSVSSGAVEETGEIIVSGDAVAVGYFGGNSELSGGFATGDMGRVCEDGSLEIYGKRRTMLVSGDGTTVFPEEISAQLQRSRYISRAAVSGRYDTRAAGIVISVEITPDYREIGAELGKKYSDNRLRLFMGREIEKLSSSLPHKVNEFRLTERKAVSEVSSNERK